MKNQYIAEIEISYKPKKKIDQLVKINNSDDVHRYFLSIWSEKINYVEEFYVLCLNRANRVLGYSRVSIGGISGCVADPKIIFQTALKANASAIIVAHNHPSGNLSPSVADMKLTNKLKSAAEFMDIDFLDHLIIAGEKYYSMAEKGVI